MSGEKKRKYSVSLQKVIDEFSLNVIYVPKSPEELMIYSQALIRPGLIIAGYTEAFDGTRVQILGNAEMMYLATLSEEVFAERIDSLFHTQPPLIIIGRSLEVPPLFIEKAKEYEVPLCVSDEETPSLVSSLFAFLNLQLAPRITQHGVLLEVYGQGVLITGESGVGKSETGIELIKRGHRLVADDAVEIRKVSAKSLVGTAPDNIRHFLELRGIGIINARHIFGMGSVKLTEKIDLVIQLELWSNEKQYDRLGIDTEYIDILGIKIPLMTIPVKPGRNTAVIVEVAALNHRQKLMGYNAAQELLNNLGLEQ